MRRKMRTSDVRVRIHENFDVHQVPQGLVLENEDALHENDFVRGQGQRRFRPVVDGVVVDGTLDGLARLQVL